MGDTVMMSNTRATKRHAVVVWVSGFLALVAVSMTVAVLLFDVKPLVVRSGSMAPAIAAGSLSVAVPTDAADIALGDVISVESAAQGGDRVTHRVVGSEPNAGGYAVTLRGDANSAADAEAHQITEADRVVLSIPGLGYAVAWAATMPGIVVIVAGGLGIAVVARRRDESSLSRMLVVTASTAACAALVAVPLTAQDTVASWSDSATMTTGDFAAADAWGNETVPEIGCWVVRIDNDQPIPGQTCEITQFSVQSIWGTAGSRQGHINIHFRAPNYNIQQTDHGAQVRDYARIKFTVDLSSANPSGAPLDQINWAGATVSLGGSGQTYGPGYTCSALPTLTAYVHNNSGTTPMVQAGIRESGVAADWNSCAR